jgi:hypothetical protein
MSKWINKLLLGVIIIFCTFSLGTAQKSTTTGSIKGTVIDQQGMSLPGVTITATSPVLMIPKVSTIADAKGFYRFLELPIGYYNLNFELSGFKTTVSKGIKIEFGMTISLNVTMEVATIEETVQVIAKAPIIDMTSSATSVTLDSTIIQNIPAVREFRQIYDMAPGVTSSTSHGSTVKDNVFTVDGVNFGDPVGGTTFTRITFDVAEEYMIESTGHSAEHGMVRGAVFNIITKSGGNEFSGAANFFYRNKNMQSANTKGTPFEGSFVGFDYNFDSTVQMGGPIFKDKLWFFANMSYQSQNTYAAGFPYDKPKQVPMDALYIDPFVKLSWQINPSMKLVGSWDYPPYWAHNRGANYQNTEATTTAQFNVVNKSHLVYSYIIGNNLIISAKAAAMFFNYDLLSKNKAPRYYDYTTLLYSGSVGYDDNYNTRRVQFKTDVTYYVDEFLGSHEFKTGFEFEFSGRHREVHHNKTSTGLGPYIYTRNGGEPYRYMDAENFNPDENLNVASFFIQDSWNLTKRLTLNLGMRYDYQEGIIPKQGEDRIPFVYNGKTYDPRVTEALKPIVWNSLAPRLGASYDLTGDGKTLLQASYGKYTLQNIINYFTGVNPNGGVNRYYNLNSDWSVGSMYSLVASSTARIDPDLQASYMTEAVVGIQRELFPNLLLKVSLIKKWDRNLLENVVLEALDVAAIKKGSYIWSGYTPVTAVDPFNGETVTFFNRSIGQVEQTSFLTNPEPAKRDYTGFELVLNKRFSNNWMMMTSYVYSKPTGLMGTDGTGSSTTAALFNDPNAHINAIGRFPDERRHQFKLQGLFQAPFGIHISTYYRLFSGLRYTRTIRSLDLGLSLNQGNVTIYAEPLGSRGLPWYQIWDLRVAKEFNIKKFKIELSADCFNVLNSNTATSVETLSSNKTVQFEILRGILDPRSIRLGARFLW